VAATGRSYGLLHGPKVATPSPRAHRRQSPPSAKHGRTVAHAEAGDHRIRTRT